MRSLASLTGHSISVVIFESASSKNNTYTQISLEIIMTSMQFSTLIPQELILSSKEFNWTRLRYVQCWLRYVLDFASQLSSSISSMNLARTLSKLIQLRSTPLPNTDLEYYLILQGITIVWLCATWRCLRMLRESIVSETEWVRERGDGECFLPPLDRQHTHLALQIFDLCLCCVWLLKPLSYSCSSSFFILSIIIDSLNNNIYFR